MNYNSGFNYTQPSLVGTLVFPGRKSVLPASTVPEYPAQAYPSLNFSSSAQQMVHALGDDKLASNNPLFRPYSYPSYSGSYFNYNNSNQYGFNSNHYDSRQHTSTTNNSNHYDSRQHTNNTNNTNNSVINIVSNNINIQNINSSGANTSTSVNKGLSMFNPLPISDFYGNQIPYNNAVVQEGLFGNVHGLDSILSRYVGDTMSTDKDSPGYTWKYTVPSQNNSSTSSATTTKTTTSTKSNTTSSTATKTNANNGLSLFNPLPISDLYGNQIPYNNAVVQEGLFGNIHGLVSILSRYVGDLMPTDKDSPGYTWKYTVPGGK